MLTVSSMLAVRSKPRKRFHTSCVTMNLYTCAVLLQFWHSHAVDAGAQYQDVHQQASPASKRHHVQAKLRLPVTFLKCRKKFLDHYIHSAGAEALRPGCFNRSPRGSDRPRGPRPSDVFLTSPCYITHVSSLSGTGVTHQATTDVCKLPGFCSGCCDMKLAPTEVTLVPPSKRSS